MPLQIPPKVVDGLIGLAGAGLALAFPAIPAVAWVGILTAVRNGDIILADLEAVFAAKGIKLSYQPSDFPDPPPGATNESNITVGKNQEPKT
jgi:hypothetical protein